MAEHEDANQKSYRGLSVSESDQDILDLAGHKEVPQENYRRWSVSESDHDVFDVPKEERIGELKNQFEILKTYIANWNRSAINGVHILVEIIKKHIAVCTTISELSKRALLQGVDLVTCGEILDI